MKFYFIIAISIVSAFEYPEFSVTINNDPYNENIFITSTAGPDHQFMAIINPDMEVKWHIVTIDGKGWDFKVNYNQKLTYFQLIV